MTHWGCGWGCGWGGGGPDGTVEHPAGINEIYLREKKKITVATNLKPYLTPDTKTNWKSSRLT